MNTYLKINKDYLTPLLKPDEKLLLAMIESYQYGTPPKTCFMSNDQFAYQLGCSTYTIRNILNFLEKANIIKREIITWADKGKNNKERQLTVNPQSEWKSELDIQSIRNTITQKRKEYKNEL